MERLHGLDGAKKKSTRFLADVAGAFPGVAIPNDYGTLVGLWLNLGRARLQHAGAVMQGSAFAFGRGPLPRELFDAIALTEEEVGEMEFSTNADRELARVKAKHGFGE